MKNLLMMLGLRKVDSQGKQMSKGGTDKRFNKTSTGTI